MKSLEVEVKKVKEHEEFYQHKVRMIEILYYRCKHENNVLTLVVGSSFLLSPASEKGKCILWVSDFY